MYEVTPADPTIRRPGDETPLAEKRKILFIYIPLVAFASMMSGIVLVKIRPSLLPTSF